MLRILLNMVSLSNVQEVLLIGSVPTELEHLNKGIQGVERCRRLEDVSALETLLDSDRPTVTAVMVAQGLPAGILISRSSDSLLSEGWWRSSDFFEVVLFCFSCFSAEHISISDVGSMVYGAIAFEGPLWVCVSDGGQHLVPFLKKVQKILRRHGKDFEQSFSGIMMEYARTIRDLPSRGADSGEAYLRKICLLRQMQQMRLLSTRSHA